jgi:hypothetical protein
MLARFAGKAKARTPPGSVSNGGEFVFTSGRTCRDQSDTFVRKKIHRRKKGLAKERHFTS